MNDSIERDAGHVRNDTPDFLYVCLVATVKQGVCGLGRNRWDWGLWADPEVETDSLRPPVVETISAMDRWSKHGEFSRFPAMQKRIRAKFLKMEACTGQLGGVGELNSPSEAPLA